MEILRREEGEMRVNKGVTAAIIAALIAGTGFGVWKIISKLEEDAARRATEQEEEYRRQDAESDEMACRNVRNRCYDECDRRNPDNLDNRNQCESTCESEEVTPCYAHQQAIREEYLKKDWFPPGEFGVH